MYEEGDIADGPNGQTLIYRGGQWVPMNGGPAPVTIGQADPTAQYAAPKAAIDLEAARARIAADAAAAARDAQAAPVKLATDQAQLTTAQLNAEKARRDLGAPSKDEGERTGRQAHLQALTDQINEVGKLYRAGPGATNGLGGILDYIPGYGNNPAFDAAAVSLEDQAASAFRIPGSGPQSDADAARIAAANKPNRWNMDSFTDQQLGQLKSRVDTMRKAAGLPAAQWYGNGVEHQTVATGDTKTVRDDSKIPAINVLQTLLRSNAPDDQVRAAASALGASPDSVSAALTFRKNNPNYKGSYDLGRLGTREEPTSARERIAGSVGGAFAANAFNDAAAGIPGAVFGTNALKAQRTANPNASAAGGLVGGVVGASALELGLARGAARLGGGILSRTFANPITADALYGGVQGGTTTGTAKGAVAGTGAGIAGGMFGRGATRVAGRGLRGVTNTNTRYLADRGVPLTIGQTLGGVVKGAEDRLAGVPLIGDVVRNRRLEGLREFNRTAFDQGLTTINATTGGAIGEEGIDLARQARSQAYRRTLDPVTLTPDAQFGSEIAAAHASAARLPADMAERGRYALDRAIENGPTSLSGSGFQQGIRRFRRATQQNAPLPNGDDLGDVMRQGEDAFTGLLSRQSPGTLPAFNAANTANRHVEVLRDAVNRARNGTRTGETGVFAPSQLADAASASARKFGNTAGTTSQPFFELSRAGQAILPSQVPDSGTAGRLALLALPSALGGAGAGAGYAGGDPGSGAVTGLGIGAALTFGGGRGVQRLATQALLDRPDALIRIGNRVYNRAAIGGMFGAGLGASGASLLAGR